MWEQLTPTDIARVKERVAARRIETLARHAEELKQLDADQAEIETFEHLVAAFTNKHLIPSASASSPTAASGENTRAIVETSEPPRLHTSPEVLGPEVHYQTSPNFGTPLRRLRG